MQRIIWKTTTAVVLVLAGGIAQAQSLAEAEGPAEFPPASYTGKQYVDSRGCAYVRAGYDGATTWVPRVSRNRKVLCGFQPSLAVQPRETAPETVVAAAPVATAPVVVAPVVATPSAGPAPVKPAPVIAAVPRPTINPAPLISTPPARTVVAATVAPAPVVNTPVVIVGGRATACPDFPATSRQYLVQQGRYKVRCGPQGTVGAAVAAPAVLGAVVTPPGYKVAWTDGRLNPNRGLTTPAGSIATRLIWTETVPRRLIDRATGLDVTQQFPNLRPPFTSIAAMMTYSRDESEPVAGVPSPDVVVSTKNVPPTAVVAVPRPAVVASHRYVQVGTFGVPANAARTAARLKAMGLPVRVGTYQKAGKTLRIVMAGPFAGATDLSSGLAAVRRAGFGDAFTRR